MVRIDPRYFRPAEVETLLGDPSKARENLGWTPTTTLEELVTEMVAADREDAKKEAYLKRKGFQVVGSIENPPTTQLSPPQRTSLAKPAKFLLMVVQANMLDVKSQLSMLVKAALAGEEVIISSYGNPQVRLVPCAAGEGLQRPGALAAALPDGLAARVDAAFIEAVDQQVAQLFNM